MDDLPVPPLQQTLEKYLVAVRPLLSDDEWRETQAAAEQTLAGEGPACQRDLEAFAATEAAAGRSWLSQAWLRGYLEVRTPLPLTSNVGFQIHPLPESQQAGIPRAAAVIRRLAGVHLAWLRGELPPEQTPRGQTVSGQQREVLAGGLRRPRSDVDEVCRGNTEPSRREIAVLIDDQLYAVPISDANGRPVPLPELEASLHAAIELRGPSTPEQAHQPLTPGFTALSYLGSAQASGYLDQLLLAPANQRVYDRLQNAIFVVNLLRETATDREHLMRTAFGTGQAWAYSPISYQVSLVDDFDGMHLEHSRVDAATLQTVLAHLDDVDDVAQDPADLASSSAADPRARALAEPLSWRLPEALAQDLDEGLRAYRQRADQLRVHLARVPMPAPAGLPFPVSDDAICQWLLLYAQLAAYGRVRSVYEAVDMRHVVAGRTECLRAATPEAVALVRALLSGQARPEHLHAGFAAHKKWVKACKTGHGIDRHLFMLSQTAAQRGTVLPLTDDLGWARLSTDLLSTTSLGSHDPIGRLTFAPTSPGGIGINYTPVGDEYEFVISWVDGEATEVASFPQHLARGSRALAELIQKAARVAAPR